MQSHVVIEEFGSLVNLSCLVIYGGVPKHEQKNVLRKGVDCVVATPGRIKDLINEGACDLSKVSQLVLDEADRMLGKLNEIVFRSFPPYASEMRYLTFAIFNMVDCRHGIRRGCPIHHIPMFRQR